MDSHDGPRSANRSRRTNSGTPGPDPRADGTKEEYAYDGLNRLVRAKYPTDRVAQYAYDAVGNRTWMADTGKGTKTRWAVSATASSTAYGVSPANATGAPDTLRWAPSTTAGSWLEVGFGAAEPSNGIRVHETQAAPFVMRIDLTDDTGASHTVYSGGDLTKDGEWLLVSYPTTAYRVTKAKLYTLPRPGSTESIDAVGLDLPSPETYAYNGFNQLESVTGADGSLTTFGYDGNGNQTTKSVRTGWVTQTTTYGYDQDNRLRRVTVPSGPPGQATVQWASSATASSELQSGTQMFSAYQATGAPSNDRCIQDGMAWAPSGGDTSAQWLKLEYATPAKAVGVRIHEEGDGRAITKIELVDEGGAPHTAWTGTDATTCGGWFEIAFAETAYNVKSVKVTTGGVAYEQIEAVGLMTAPPEGPTLTSTYAYDANGLRVSKSDTSGETRYLLDGLSVVAQYAPSGERQAFYVQSLARIDEVLSVVNSVGKFWYQADALGSVYTLTTAAGDVRARGGYDVFGEPVAEYGQQVGQPFGFTGREHELESGLVYSRARYLQPGVGRWGRPDPLGFVDGPSRYLYTRSDPVNATDPSGLMRLGKSWDRPEFADIKVKVQAALDLLRGGVEGQPIRCFFRYWKGTEDENPFLDNANDVRIEWASGEERIYGASGHTRAYLSDIIYIDTVWPGGGHGDFSSTYSVTQFAETIAHETTHNVYNQVREAVPEYVGSLLMITNTPFHGASCCSQISLSLGQYLRLIVSGRP